MTAPSSITCSVLCRTFWTRIPRSPALSASPTACSRFLNSRGFSPAGSTGWWGLGPLSADSGNYLLSANGATEFPSEALDERQREITNYAILSYLRSDGNLDTQISLFGRYSSLNFTPGANEGDILYDGIAQSAYKRDEAYGVQAEGAWHLGSDHTIRFGLLWQSDDLVTQTSSMVLPVDMGGPANPNLNPLCLDPTPTAARLRRCR